MRRIEGFISFSRTFEQIKTLTALFRTWTCFAASISYNDNRYATAFLIYSYDFLKTKSLKMHLHCVYNTSILFVTIAIKSDSGVWQRNFIAKNLSKPLSHGRHRSNISPPLLRKAYDNNFHFELILKKKDDRDILNRILNRFCVLIKKKTIICFLRHKNPQTNKKTKRNDLRIEKKGYVCNMIHGKNITLKESESHNVINKILLRFFNSDCINITPNHLG